MSVGHFRHRRFLKFLSVHSLSVNAEASDYLKPTQDCRFSVHASYFVFLPVMLLTGFVQLMQYDTNLLIRSDLSLVKVKQWFAGFSTFPVEILYIGFPIN